MLAQLEVLKAENERLRQELEAIKTQVGLIYWQSPRTNT